MKILACILLVLVAFAAPAAPLPVAPDVDGIRCQRGRCPPPWPWPWPPHGPNVPGPNCGEGKPC